MVRITFSNTYYHHSTKGENKNLPNYFRDWADELEAKTVTVYGVLDENKTSIAWVCYSRSYHRVDMADGKCAVTDFPKRNKMIEDMELHGMSDEEEEESDEEYESDEESDEESDSEWEYQREEVDEEGNVTYKWDSGEKGDDREEWVNNKGKWVKETK